MLSGNSPTIFLAKLIQLHKHDPKLDCASSLASLSRYDMAGIVVDAVPIACPFSCPVAFLEVEEL